MVKEINEKKMLLNLLSQKLKMMTNQVVVILSEIFAILLKSTKLILKLSLSQLSQFLLCLPELTRKVPIQIRVKKTN